MTMATTGLVPIGEAARRVGVAASALRYYDERDLVRPARRVGGRRWYGRDELRLLAFVQLTQRLGMSLEAIAGVLDGAGGSWRDLVESHIGWLDDRINHAARARRILDHARSCPHDQPWRNCPYLLAELDTWLAEDPARRRADLPDEVRQWPDRLVTTPGRTGPDQRSGTGGPRDGGSRDGREHDGGALRSLPSLPVHLRPVRELLRRAVPFAQVVTVDRDGCPVGRTMPATLAEDWSVDLLQPTAENGGHQWEWSPATEIIWVAPPPGEDCATPAPGAGGSVPAPRVVYLRGRARPLSDRELVEAYQRRQRRDREAGRPPAADRSPADIVRDLTGVRVEPIHVRAEGFEPRTGGPPS